MPLVGPPRLPRGRSGPPASDLVRKRRAANGFEEVELDGKEGIRLSGSGPGEDEGSDDESHQALLRARLEERKVLEGLRSKEELVPASLNPESQSIWSLLHRSRERRQAHVGTLAAAAGAGITGQPQGLLESNTRTAPPPAASLLLHSTASRGLPPFGRSSASLGSGNSRRGADPHGQDSQPSFLGRQLAPSAAGVARVGTGTASARGFIFGSNSLRGDESNLGEPAGASRAVAAGEKSSGAVSGVVALPLFSPMPLADAHPPSSAVPGRLGPHAQQRHGVPLAVAQPEPGRGQG